VVVANAVVALAPLMAQQYIRSSMWLHQEAKASTAAHALLAF